jgi:hypothetical protein
MKHDATEFNADQYASIYPAGGEQANGVGFRAIGFSGDRGPSRGDTSVASCFASAGFAVVREDLLGVGKLRATALYDTWLLERKS